MEELFRKFPRWPLHIRRGETLGTLCGAQPLFVGDAVPIYRFPDRESIEVSYRQAAVRVPAAEDSQGVVRCGKCGKELLCDKYGNMPDVCPSCHEGIDWSDWKEKK